MEENRLDGFGSFLELGTQAETEDEFIEFEDEDNSGFEII